MLASDFVLGIGNRWANRHTGFVEVYTKGRTSCTSTSSRRRSAGCSRPTTALSDAKAALSCS
jgi:tartronate-semialdehyde synthase